MNRILKQSVGIPVAKIGERLTKLNEAIKASGMAVAADNNVEINCINEDRAISVQLKVYFLDEEGDKKC